MTSPTTPQIPIKKSTEAMKVYQDQGPKFGKILRNLYTQITNGDVENLEGRFITACEKAYGQNPHGLARAVNFPFAGQVNYLGEPFGHAICISKGSTVAHGRPLPKVSGIEHGDIVSVDCGASIPYGTRWLHLDAAFTIAIGGNQQWVDAPHQALKEIVAMQPTNTMDLAAIIRNTARAHHLTQVVSMTGHGIGYKLHEAPTIHNAPGEFLPVELFDGLCFCAEPIFVNPGNSGDGPFISPTCIGADGWEVSTVSGAPASHFETTFGTVDGQIIDLVGVSSWRL